MTKFFNKIQKTLFSAHFCGIFPIFKAKTIFPENPALSAKLHMGFQHHAKIQKKLMIQFQENAWTDRQKDGQTLFYRTLPAITRNPKSCFFHYFLKIQLILESCVQSGNIHFLTKPTLIFFNQLFISINLCEHAKKIRLFHHFVRQIYLFYRYI